jgi:hypothetical protein
MEEAPELKALTLRFYEAISKGDLAFIRKLTSSQQGVLGIGTDPNEWWAGGGTLAKKFQAQLEEMGGRMEIVPGDPDAYREGSVGWMGDRAAWRLQDGTEVPFRLTAIFHKENGDWKIVQFHTSVGVPNESTVGMALPT